MALTDVGTGTVSQVVLSADYAAVRVDGQVMLHPYDPDFKVSPERADKRFPTNQSDSSKGGEKNVTWVSMTNDFLVYGTARGFVHYFYIKQVGLGFGRHAQRLSAFFCPHSQSACAYSGRM